MIENIGSAADVGMQFQLVSDADGAMDSVGFMWGGKAENDGSDSFADHDIVYAAKFYTEDGADYPLGVSGAQKVAELKDGRRASTMSGFAQNGRFSAVMTVDDYDTNVVSAHRISDRSGNTTVFTAESRSNMAVIDYTPSLSAQVGMQYDEDSVVPGIEVPVTVTVENTGTAALTDITVKIGAVEKTFGQLCVNPAAS